MKKPWLAFLLNFVLAGAGLAYLRLWMWAVLNLVVTIVLAFAISHYAPGSLSWAPGVVPATNGTIAMAVAKSMNLKRSQTAPPAQSLPAA